MKFKRLLIGPLVCAFILNAAYPPLGWSVLAFFLLVPLLPHMQLSWKKRFLWGWAAGFAMQASAFWWIFITIRDFGGQPLWVCSVGSLLFWAYHGLDMALWLCLAPLTAPFKSPFLRAMGYAATWYVIQLELFPYVFPWNLGSALAGTPLLGDGLALWGADGVTFLVAFIGISLVLSRQ